ncbi:dihydrofolate reductase [Novosphingobium humi]|uniref:dihydrofolate reductase n=1 Tax=Novosphingobium humi TaxID=2282397 RepID=UPI0025AFB443|nr:dihydrofolate reductase [Novosphingobium humi]WJS99095.1 dihydrofolate reductase [Novosphingobium humi]
MTRITLVVARAANGVIGADGTMPWHLPADLRHFKAKTMGRPMVMGRKTFESLPGVLPGRRHIVMTRDAGWSAPGAEVATDLAGALALAGDVAEVCVVGGGQIYAQFMPIANRIELTEIYASPEGDTHFPMPTAPEWVETAREGHPAQEGRPAFAFVTLERAG